MKTEIQEKLEALALTKSIPFCYGCYKDAPSGQCETCGSDDLMRKLPGVGVEYGTEWVIQYILSEELTPVNLEEAFGESLSGCYEETTQVGWMTLDTINVMKTMDPISWQQAQSEWEDMEVSEGNIISFDNGNTYYYANDLEDIIAT